MSRINETIQAKRLKRAQLEEKGILAHPYSFNKQHTIAQALESLGKEVTTAGRIMSVRTHGKVTFYDIQDSTAKIQILVRAGNTHEDSIALTSLIDSGDYIGVNGEVITSKTGETTILAQTLEFLGKALRPIPSQWNAAENKEARFRKRYLDMLINPDTKQILDSRWLIVKEIRRFLQDKHDFVEVETPIFQPLYGGTNATPFTTHMNALDCQFYLRLAPELYLKRLIVGGYDRIFEIARNFRNEGIDQTHQPEFSMIEWYQTYADYNTMMDVAEELLRHLIQKVHGSTKMKVFNQEIEMGGTWARITMKQSINQHLGFEFDKQSDEDLQKILSNNNLDLNGTFTRGKALFAIFDKLVSGELIEPTWIIDYPRDVSPLAKKHRLDPTLAERFELYIAGKELADGWSEITDPIDQRNLFENEQQNMRDGDTEAHPLDEDFLEAMEYGVPPLGGIGMGIDRLVMFLTNTWSIKEVIAFPTLKPLTPSQSKQHKVAENADDLEDESNLGSDRSSLSSGDTSSGSRNASSSSGSLQISSTSTVSAEDLPSRDQAVALLEKYIKNEALQHHCYMVAQAMEAYATKLGENTELWYQTGLLHDLDWEAFPDEHPAKAINDILPELYPQEMLNAIAAHAPERTGKQPETQLERYLFACDEMSGFMYAVSLMRPGGFSDMKPKSITKKMKDKAFAAGVSREDLHKGAELIDTDLNDHIAFLITVFQ
jgi:lysyl-tRNA synthetase class 2